MSRQVVVVTGAGSGIGRAICFAFGERGAAVVAMGRRMDRLEETSGLVKEAGGECQFVSVDVGDAGSVFGAFDGVVEKWGRVDVLVNNAGYGPRATIEKMDVGMFEAMLGANVRGVFHCCKAVWPVMKKQGGGVIVNVSSMAAKEHFRGLGVYGATKCFVNGMTHMLAEEGRNDGVLVFGVAPGAVETEMLRGAFPNVPADMVLGPEAIAGMVVELTGEACRFSTGQVVNVRR